MVRPLIGAWWRLPSVASIRDQQISGENNIYGVSQFLVAGIKETSAFSAHLPETTWIFTN
jgi:hypothetical protein